MVQALWIIVRRLFKILKIRTTMYDPAIPSLSINLKEMKSLDRNEERAASPCSLQYYPQ